MSCVSPLPAVFLDRDGVINHSLVSNGKPLAPRRLEDFQLFDDVPQALSRLKDLGFLLIVATNQPDVGNGLVERDVVEKMNRILLNDLPIDAVKVCYHAQTAGCHCRKPKPGLLTEAANELNVDLANSFMIGDRWSDVDAGRSAGCRTIFIDRGYSEPRPSDQDFDATSLEVAVKLIAARAPAKTNLPVS